MTRPGVEELAQRFGPSYKWWATATVMTGCVTTVLSSTMINVAMPDIMGEFGMGQDRVQWLSTAFLASMTACMLTTAWALATLGPKKAYLVALAMFTAGSLVGGMSFEEGGLILARAMQGSAAGLVQPLAMVVIFSVFDPTRRGMAMGIYGLGIVLAPAVGPTVGGMLIDNYSWRYIFLVSPALCITAAVLAMIFLPDPERKSVPFDLPGFILLCLTVGSFLAALSNGQRDGWDSGFVRGGFGLSACALGLFLLRESTCKDPLLTLDVYKNPRFVAASAVSFIFGMAVFGSTYLVPLFVQLVQEYTPTAAGMLLMPAGLTLGVVSPTAGRLSDRVPPYMLILLGLGVFATSSLLMTQADTSTDFWQFAGWVMLGRVGLGCITPSVNSGALRILEAGQMGQGAGSINFMRQLGGAVGVTTLSVYLERQTGLYAQAFNDLQTGGLFVNKTMDTISFVLRSVGVTDNPAQALHPQETYRFYSTMIAAQAQMMGFRECFLFVAVVCFAAMVPAWFMRPGRRHRTRAKSAAP